MTEQLLEKEKTPEKKRKWLFPVLFLLALIIVVVGLSRYIKNRTAPPMKKRVNQAAALLKDYGVVPDDLFPTIRQKVGEEKFDELMKQSEEMENSGQEKPPVNVVVQKLVPVRIRDKINLPGIVRPWVKLEVLAEVSGKVARKRKKEGDFVKKGDVIAVLDSRDYRNIFNSAKASFETAQASYNRLKKLQKGQLSTRSQIDEAKARVENAKSVLDTAALNLERCTIQAPISGLINKVFVDTGQFLNHSDPIVEIIRMDQVKVIVGIPESDVDAVRKIRDFDVRIEALGGKTFQARKHFLSRTADEKARLYNLELKVANPTGEILPDMFTRVEIVKKDNPKSVSIPLYSVITRNSDRIVYTIEDGVSRERKVDVGIQEGWQVEITRGLSFGEKVVIVGQRNVHDGQKVLVVRTVEDPREIQE